MAPDLPLIGLTAGAFAWFSGVQGWTAGETLRHVFDDLFFTHPAWIAAHRTLGWFAAGCAVHVAGDVPLHHDDGPLLLFPLDWQLRFQSPVSYWDATRYADIVRPLEMALVLALTAYLLWPVARRRLRGTPVSRAAGANPATGGSDGGAPDEPAGRADDPDKTA